MTPRKIYRVNSFRYGFLPAVFLSILFISNLGITSDGCSDCRRKYGLAEFVNIHAPDIQERRKQWVECMKKALPPGYQTFDNNDPVFKEALEKCKHLYVGDIDLMSKSFVQSRIFEVLHDDCFILSGDAWDYFFEGSYEVFENQEAPGNQIRAIGSRMILNLFYNGNSKELVETFQTESPGKGSETHLGRMFDNCDAALKRYIPIIERLRDFEKRPQSCRIEPDKGELGPEEEIEIDLKDFKDEKGNTSREFNRVIVEAREGKILNGVQSAEDEKKRVFTVGSGTITLKYKAPNSCDIEEDALTIFNSCDIVGEAQLPLSQTRVDSEIETKTIRIVCYEAKITRSTYSRYIPSGYSEDTQEIEVTLRLQLEPFQETSTLLKIKSYEVDSFTGKITYEHGPSSDRKTDVWTLSLVTPNTRTFSSNVINLVRDRVSKKVTKAVIPIYIVDLIWSGSDEIEPPKSLTIGPVSEQQDVRLPKNRRNPAAMQQFLNSSLNQDFQVTKGDGLNSFGGEARVESTSPEGDLKKIEILRWEIRRK